MQADCRYYAVVLGVISLLTNLVSASRLPIYLSCQSELRKEVYELLKNISSEHTMKQSNLRRQAPFVSYQFSLQFLLYSYILHIVYILPSLNIYSEKLILETQ